MAKTLQVVLQDDEHQRFKLWCTSKGKSMAEFVREVIMKCIEGFDPEEVIKEVQSIETCKHIELATASGAIIRLPIPNIVEKHGAQIVITVPDDTGEEDVELISTVPNSVVKTNKDWRTQIPLEVK